MDDQALPQLIAAAVAETQRPLLAALAELREELAQVRVGRGDAGKPTDSPISGRGAIGSVHRSAVGSHSVKTGGRLPGESDGRADRAWLTLAEVAALFQVSAPTVVKMIDREGLPAIRVGKQWRLRRDEIERWAVGKHPGRQHGSGSA